MAQSTGYCLHSDNLETNETAVCYSGVMAVKHNTTMYRAVLFSSVWVKSLKDVAAKKSDRHRQGQLYWKTVVIRACWYTLSLITTLGRDTKEATRDWAQCPFRVACTVSCPGTVFKLSSCTAFTFKARNQSSVLREIFWLFPRLMFLMTTPHNKCH